MSEQWARIQMIQLEASRLRAEAALTNDPGRLTAIGDEMQVLYNSLVDIRREQILESMPKQKVERRRWWNRLTRTARG